MKKLLCALLIISLSLCACERNKADGPMDMNIETVVDDVENLCSFDVLDGRLYCAVYYDSGKYADNVGEPHYESGLIVRNSGDDNIANKYIFDENVMPRNLTCANKDTFYYTVPRYMSDGIERNVLMRYSLGEKSAEQVYVFEGYTDVKKLELADGILYALCSYPCESADTELNERYTDKGRCLVSVDINTFDEAVIMKDEIIDFSSDESNALFVYAHDSGGYYFMRYDPKTNAFSAKAYKDIGQADSVCAYKNGKFIACGGVIPSGAAIYSLDENGYIPLFTDDNSVYGKCKLADGKFYCMSDGMSVTDISTLLTRRIDNTIRMATLYSFIGMPNVSGFPIEKNVLNDDEKLALAALSHDPNYDAYFLYTTEPFSLSLRNKGAFYPLNDVEGVQEYLDACFPFIKEAAVNQNGDVWMLPLTVQPHFIYYNAENCEKEGIVFSDDMSVDDYIDILLAMNADGKTNYESGPIFSYPYTLVADYLMHYSKFDTSEFRELAIIIKDRIYANLDKLYNNPMSSAAAMQDINGYYNSMSFFVTTRGAEESGTIYKYWKDNGRVVRLPNSTGNEGCVADCYFICVNPYSDNLENILAYVTAYCKNALRERMNDDDPHKNNDLVSMFVDAELYKRDGLFSDMRELYETSEIRFTFPEEIYKNDFDKYLAGEITLDSFIKEADRKLKTYLNE